RGWLPAQGRSPTPIIKALDRVACGFRRDPERPARRLLYRVVDGFTGSFRTISSELASRELCQRHPKRPSLIRREHSLYWSKCFDPRGVAYPGLSCAFVSRYGHFQVAIVERTYSVVTESV